ncbi:DegT/DnrJ/EryC1/StrS aminotransferase family protein [Candidatus Pelagibacter bacterium]|nr:DegT/DnrJ/EryC1/StrS aminotransferase family protein [Candidatus Pelagibacter bacterium]MDA8836199.1 DegT/DnrJ/EryC1/StrS aminotransferase family protein [Candidatus Pelagibacter bacterium]
MKLSYPNFDKYALKRVQQVLKSGRVNYWTGNECKDFEKEFSNYHNVKYSLSVSNGSVALEMALKVLNLKKTDSVIVTPRSFVISASCVLNLGLKPIFADVDDNGNLSIDGIRKVYNKNVKAIIVVHLNGLSCDLDPILNFVKQKKLFLIEDCSQAHGAIYKGKKVGSFGHISTWSFCQDKIMSTGGEGGMISTNNTRLWLKLWSLKDHGKNYKSVFYKKHKIGFKWLHDDLGSNYRMTEMQAAIGREQLKSLDKQIKKRNLIANLYLNGLKDYYLKYDILKKPNLKFQTYPQKQNLKKSNQYIHAFYRLNLFINKNMIKQNDLIQQLNKNKINCGVGSCAEIYREKIFKKLKFYPKKRLVNAKLLGETSITLPINPNTALTKVKSEISFLKKILDKYL